MTPGERRALTRQILYLCDGGHKLVPPMGTGDEAAMLLESLVRHEGVRLSPYQDSLGFWTVGVGHLMRRQDGPHNVRWPVARVASTLLSDAKTHAQEALEWLCPTRLQNNGAFTVEDVYWRRAPYYARVALGNMAFNLGGQKLAKWTNTRKLARAGDWEAVAAGLENSKWWTQVGRRGPEIQRAFRGDMGWLNE